MYKAKFSTYVVSFQYRKYPYFPIIVLYYSGFLKCSLPKCLYWSFLLLAQILFFLSSNKSPKKLYWSTQSNSTQIRSFSLFSPCLSSNITPIWFIVLLFLNLYSLSLWTVFETREECPFCPLLYCLSLENMIKLTLYVLFTQKNVFSCSFFVVHFDFHFLI